MAASWASLVAVAGSTTVHPPSGGGQGAVKSVDPGPPEPPRAGSGCSVRVNVSSASVPTTWYVPQVVPEADSFSATASQSHPVMSGPPHCGGYDSITPPRQSWGPWPRLSSTVASAS